MEQKIYSSLATEILRNSKPTGSCFIVELVVRMANGMLFLQLGRVLESQPSPKLMDHKWPMCNLLENKHLSSATFIQHTRNTGITLCCFLKSQLVSKSLA